MVCGDRIRALRLKHALTQGALARMVEKDDRYIGKMERGRQPNCTTETLEHFADALQCSTDYLLGRSGSPRPRA